MSDIQAVTMPKIGLTMEEGTVALWQVAEGDAVAPGQHIVDIEIEKSTNEVEARVAGVMRRQVAAESQVLPVGALMAVIAPADAADAEIDAFIRNFKPVETA
jgi:pyruvate dehydrogenase E2 component (dihydrolipoamide acetyltransferase)